MALLALATAFVVVRVAFVAAYAERNPGRAAALWPGHPAVVFALGLAHIGEQGATGQPVTADEIRPLFKAARSAPLASEPYLVRGVELRVGGNEAAAGKAFAEAKNRNPRSVPARFFLSDHYLRSGAVEAGLGEIAALARLLPGSADRLAPVLATYVVAPGGLPRVKEMLRAHPALEAPLLLALAGNPANADLILSLASKSQFGEGQRPGWHARLVDSLFTAGDHAKAHAVWARLSGEDPGSARSALFDPRFERPSAMPPFGWALASGAAGLVEPQDGGLHVLYYGRDTLVLAQQALLLAPGDYLLTMKLSGGGEEASALAWTVTCLPSNAVVLTLDLARAASAREAGRFTIPATGCAAQRLKLSGTAPEFPGTVDLILSNLKLERPR